MASESIGKAGRPMSAWTRILSVTCVLLAFLVISIGYYHHKSQQFPDNILGSAITSIEGRIDSSNDRMTFDQLKLNITSLMVKIWETRSLQDRETASLVDRLESEYHQLVHTSVWRLDKSLQPNNNEQPDSDGQVQEETVKLKEFYERAHALLGSTHTISLKLQNLTEVAQESLTGQRSGGAGNDTWWGSLKHDVGDVTDKLSSEKRKDFEIHVAAPDNKLETVVSLDTHHLNHQHDSVGEPALSIMDSKSNKYVLAHPAGIKSLAAHSEDPSLIIDIILLFLLGYLCGAVFELVGLPSLLGNIVAGIIVGPSCLDKIDNVVQVSSIGQIGALLLLLELGREFSLDKLLKSHNMTIFGTTIFSLLCALSWGIFGRLVLGSGFGESCFIGLMISFTSTAVSIKCITQSSVSDLLTARYLQNLGVGDLIAGILLMQDAIFSTVISVIPLLARTSEGSSLTAFGQLVFFLMKATCTAGLTAGAVYAVIAYQEKFGKKSKAAVLLVAFASILLCHGLDISGEFGAFFTGLSFALLSPTDRNQDHQTKDEGDLIRILKDFFCTLFFASLGLFIDVFFIKEELVVLLAGASIAIISKFIIMYGLTRGPFNMGSTKTLLISLNLAQISELSMALGSKGRRLGIISREVYLLFVASTMVCLVVVPVIWKVAVGRLDKYYVANDHASTEMTEHA